VGNWREGMDRTLQAAVAGIEDRQKQGFTLLPIESTLMDLTSTLDAYDLVIPDLIGIGCACEGDVEVLEAL
jgi:hypothetical protein